MERRLIDTISLIDAIQQHSIKASPEKQEAYRDVLWEISQAPTISAVEVVRCRECAYFRDKHVLTPDGQRKSYSEFPPEAFRGLDDTSVTCSYGINVGSQCLVDCDSGYGEDKTVFRQPNDYCSRGVRREHDGDKTNNLP